MSLSHLSAESVGTEVSHRLLEYVQQSAYVNHPTSEHNVVVYRRITSEQSPYHIENISPQRNALFNAMLHNNPSDVAQIVRTVDEVNHVSGESEDGAGTRTFGPKVESSPEDAVFE